MVTSLEQLFNFYSVSEDERIDIRKICKPSQTKYISLLQWFGKEKMMKFDVSLFMEDHRFIPYGMDTYGLYSALGYKLCSEDETLNTVFNGYRREYGFPVAIVKFNKEEYNKDKDEWENYWRWKKNRNKVRAELEESYGFDGKHAMHLVRLLKMGKEILETGEVLVKRSDAKELLSIRNGAWSYEKIVEYAEEMDNLVRGELYKKTSLPKKPDVNLAANVLMEVQEMFWNRNNVK